MDASGRIPPNTRERCLIAERAQEDLAVAMSVVRFGPRVSWNGGKDLEAARSRSL